MNGTEGGIGRAGALSMNLEPGLRKGGDRPDQGPSGTQCSYFPSLSPGPYEQLRPELGPRSFGEWGSPQAWDEAGGSTAKSVTRVP